MSAHFPALATAAVVLAVASGRPAILLVLDGLLALCAAGLAGAFGVAIFCLFEHLERRP